MHEFSCVYFRVFSQNSAGFSHRYAVFITLLSPITYRFTGLVTGFLPYYNGYSAGIFFALQSGSDSQIPVKQMRFFLFHQTASKNKNSP